MNKKKKTELELRKRGRRKDSRNPEEKQETKNPETQKPRTQIEQKTRKWRENGNPYGKLLTEIGEAEQ